MDCIKCNSSQVRVIDTRAKGTRRIYRRRVCMMCGCRWTTVELPVGDVRQAVDAVNGLRGASWQEAYCKAIKSATSADGSTTCAPRAAWRSITSYSGADGASCLSGTASRSGCATTITMSRPLGVHFDPAARRVLEQAAQFAFDELHGPGSFARVFGEEI